LTYVIGETCIDVKDKACVEVCPVDCIIGSDEDRMLYINPLECIDCGACVDPCPVDAIYAEEDLPREWSHFTEINEQYFTDPDAARARVKQIKPRVGQGA
jgi:NAD-dependent dihydropyrimidine dehydrogenase PreA subunit